MNLSKPLPPTPQTANKKNHWQCAKPYQIPSHHLQHKISDLSNPVMIDDVGSSGSESSIDDYSHHSSTEIGTEIWDSYWSPSEEFLIGPSLPKRPPLQNQFFNLSYANRNFATSDLSGLNKTATQETLRRPGVSPTIRRVSQPKPTRRNEYSPFPPAPAPPTPPPHATHHSWPRRLDSRSQRPRAQTTPSQSRPPSNLSTCTALDHHSPTTSGTGTPLYMASPPATPLFAPPFVAFPPLDYMPTKFTEEVSQFEEDDDDDEEEEEEEEKSASTKLKKMLHIRSSSEATTPENNPAERLRRKSLRKLRKSLSDAASDANETFKGVFRTKK